MTSRQKALTAIIVCILFWGLSFISIKIAVECIPPMTLGAIRFAMAIVVLFFIKKKIAPNEKLKKADLPLLAGAGLTGVTLYFLFENNGVLRINASEASIIVGSVPVITLIAERVGEKISVWHRRKWRGNNIGDEAVGKAVGKKTFLHKYVIPGAGALISLAGVTLVAGVSFALSGSAAGYFFMGGACCSWVVYCFLTRPLFVRCSRIYIVFWQSVIGFIGFLPFAVFEAPWQMPSLYVWSHVIFLGTFCSAMGYWLYSLSLKELGVEISALFINFIPVISAVCGFLILGERLQPLQWLGAVLVLAGVYLAMLPSRKPA